jgi:hypothetical protein
MPALLARRRPLPKPSPESDPRFRKVMEQLKAGASKTKAHPPAAKKAAEAAAAAKGPPNERIAAGKQRQVDKIKEAPAKKPERSSFLALLRAEIDKAMPKTLGDTEHFDEKADQMKGGLASKATQQKNEAAGGVAGASRETPAPAGEAKSETPIPPEGAPAPPSVSAGEGMPAPKSDAEVSLQDSKQETDQQMRDAEVTPTQLQKANDPRFSSVLQAKEQVARQADAAPAQYRARETATLGAAAAAAQNTSRQGAAAMIGVRRGSGTRVLTRQQQQRARDEARRREVVTNIENIFNNTKKSVEQKLSTLDAEVAAMFDPGTEAALTAMKTFVEARIRAYKIDRYLSIPFVGAARWIRDQFRGLPAEVNVFYEQGRALFRERMDALIVRVANLVERRLKEAKDEVARGQAAIKTYVNSLGPELRNIGQQAQRDVAGRFEELERSIDDKKNQLAQSLASKYKEAFDKANEALKAIQDANQGLVAGFVGKLLEVIRAILEFKDKLMSILRKGAAAIKLIIADPIGFLGNLIAAVAGGIRQFARNIETHMVEGFKQWLFGSLGGLGIEVPRDLTLPSILKLVLSVLGITYDRMREKAVRLIGERNVALIEKLVEYIRVLITGGPAALWEKVKEDLASLKEMVIDAIKNYVIETAVKRGIAKIVTMFNPVGAIIAAVMAIYDIVVFVVEKATQIMAFVESVVNSVYDIATGNISGAIAKVEQSLARTIPLLIGFLAQFAGLGKITAKIQEFIKKIQAKVDTAIDKAIAKIVALVKRMFGRGGIRDATDAGAPNTVKARVRQALRSRLAGARTTEQVSSVVNATFAEFSSQGLKSLRVQHGSAVGQFKILMSASAEEEGGTANVQPAIPVGDIIAQLDPDDLDPSRRLTILVADINGRSLGRIPSQSMNRHAEEVLLSRLRTDTTWQRPNRGRNTLTINITRSPCGTTSRNCAFKLLEFSRSSNTQLVLRVASIYEGTERRHSASSRTALEMLTLNEDNPARLEVWLVLRELARYGIPESAIKAPLRTRLEQRLRVLRREMVRLGVLRREMRR